MRNAVATGFGSINKTFQFDRGFGLKSQRWLFSHSIAANLHLYTEKPRQIVIDTKNLRLGQDANGKSLALIIPYLWVKPKHLEKYCKLYIDLGFDVLVAKVAIMHAVRPVSGAQVLTHEVLSFLANNDNYQKIVVHGFSAGGYVWGEFLVHLHRNGENVANVSRRIKAQIWDSVVGFDETGFGLSGTIFPKNKFAQNLAGNAFNFFRSTVGYKVSIYHNRAEEFFNSKPVEAPALMFCSKVDKLAPESSMRRIANNFEAASVKVTFKVFDDSPHVLHYSRHKEEYLNYLLKHLRSCGLIG